MARNSAKRRIMLSFGGLHRLLCQNSCLLPSDSKELLCFRKREGNQQHPLSFLSPTLLDILKRPWNGARSRAGHCAAWKGLVWRGRPRMDFVWAKSLEAQQSNCGSKGSRKKSQEKKMFSTRHLAYQANVTRKLKLWHSWGRKIMRFWLSCSFGHANKARLTADLAASFMNAWEKMFAAFELFTLCVENLWDLWLMHLFSIAVTQFVKEIDFDNFCQTF